ncbi:copper amine oxidase [Armillaria novae-zelandiae]|uniref:Amine oxidase n=1 Tax=Armillaria novae-zelandiae TaxID=153914 RepID=A0AA39PAD9_9AGAR|nr:copper amine oxidase [Armillaria novae-zelandiae]
MANGAILSVPRTKFPELSEDVFAVTSRPWIPPPLKPFDFLPDLMQKNEENLKPRDDIKPLHVVQPEGVSFKLDGNELEWQNWDMHISLTHHKGIALSTITYNDNELQSTRILGNLPLIQVNAVWEQWLMSYCWDVTVLVKFTTCAVVIKNTICIHEEDNGVLWKHTDYRPGGHTQTVRRIWLVVSMVCTLANYEYIWNYHFYQGDSIELEVHLTGILQVYVAETNEPIKFGTKVVPNVNAQYHQHLFSSCVDPMIDCINNSTIESNVVPLPNASTGSDLNFGGNAFIQEDTVLKKEAGRDWDWEKEQKWKIVNLARQHYSSRKDVGYVVRVKGGVTLMMARKDGWALKRAEFLNYPVWVCRDVEGAKGSRMWPAGKMPVEHLNITLKPQSFFTMNPSMDIPGTRDPKSVAAFSQEAAPSHGHAGCH